MTPLNHVLSKLGNIKKQGTEYIARCPSHEDKTPSLSVTENDGKVLLHCHAGCDTADILAKIGLEAKDLFSDRPKSEPIATYDYTDESGKLLYQVIRKIPKGFSQRRPDGNGGWVYNLSNVQRVPYNLPAVIGAVKAGTPIYVVEGEKDADSLTSLGLVATTNSGGAGKWTDSLSEHFRSAKAAILPDNDIVGKDHAEKVAASLHGGGAEVKIVGLPGLADKGDVSDWLNAGHSKAELISIVKETPLWEPNATEPQPEPFAVPLADFMAGDCEVTWLWDEILAKPSLGILAAKPKFGKTLLTFNLAIAASRGIEYLGRAIEKTNVLIIQLEDPPVIIRNRLKKMSAEGDGLYIRAGLPMNKEDWLTLAEFIKENEIGLTIIGPFIFAIRGNEQDATATGTFLREIRELIFATNSSVLLVHHHRKSSGEHGDAIRGSSAILGAVDVALELIREDEDDPNATLKVTSRFASVEPETLSLNIDTLTWSSQGSASDYKSSKREREIIEALDVGEMDIEALAETLDLSKPAFHKELKKLVAEKRVIEAKIKPEGGGRPRLFYRLQKEFCNLRGVTKL